MMKREYVSISEKSHWKNYLSIIQKPYATKTVQQSE